MKNFKIIIEDSQGNKARLSISAESLEAAIDKVKGYNPDMNCKVYGEGMTTSDYQGEMI